LGSEGASEFLSWQVALAQDVVILKELLQSDAVSFHNLFDFHHEVVVSLNTIEVSESVSESGLGTSGGAIDNVLKAVGSSQEFVVFDAVFLVAVDQSDSVNLLLVDLEAKAIKDLAEDLGSDLE